MKYWGYLNDKDNASLEKVAQRFHNRIKKTKSEAKAAEVVREFMREYLQIGEDPTDTVIRDIVWKFLLRTTRAKIRKEQLDEIWTSEVKRSQQLCVIS